MVLKSSPPMAYRRVTYVELLGHANTLGIRVIPWNDCTKGELIGKGGSMLVYNGTCEIDGEEHKVAFKHAIRILTDKTKEKMQNNVLSDIRQEIRLMGRLKGHPHVLQLIGVSFNNLTPVLVVELAEGNLEYYLEENDVDWKSKIKLSMEIALGLEAIHSAGIMYMLK